MQSHPIKGGGDGTESSREEAKMDRKVSVVMGCANIKLKSPVCVSEIDIPYSVHMVLSSISLQSEGDVTYRVSGSTYQ
jgi:hypothetical protein